MHQLRVRDAEALRDQKAAGSNPATSTPKTKRLAIKQAAFFVRFSQICTGVGQVVDSMGRGKLGREGVKGLLRIG